MQSCGVKQVRNYYTLGLKQEKLGEDEQISPEQESPLGSRKACWLNGWASTGRLPPRPLMFCANTVILQPASRTLCIQTGPRKSRNLCSDGDKDTEGDCACLTESGTGCDRSRLISDACRRQNRIMDASDTWIPFCPNNSFIWA